MKPIRKLVQRLGNRASWVLSAKIIASLLVLVYAANITVTTTTYQSEFGSTLSTASGLIAVDKGFSVALSTVASGTGTSCSSPVVFSNTPGIANTTITAGHFVYDVQVNATGIANPNIKYNVTLTLASSAYGPLCIQNASSPAIGQRIDCKFDVGTALPAIPYSFKVTVQ
jgi:hypothetical protein